MRGKWLLAAGVVVLAAVAAGALTLLWRRTGKEPAAQVGMPASKELAAGEVSLPGIIEAQEVVAVASPVDGTIDAFFVEEGQEVAEGQLLAQIRNTGLEAERDASAAELERVRSRVNGLDSRLIAARLEATRARAEASRARGVFERAERTYQRQQFLHREGATPRLKFEASQREFESAKTDHANLEEVARLAEEQVSRLLKDLDAARQVLAEQTRELEEAGARVAAGEVRAPVTGLVVGRRGQPGEAVRVEGQELFEIAVNLAALAVISEPAPDVLARIRPGQEALVQVAEAPGEGIPGKVRDVQGGQVIVDFTSPGPAVKPGLTAQVRIKLT